MATIDLKVGPHLSFFWYETEHPRKLQRSVRMHFARPVKDCKRHVFVAYVSEKIAESSVIRKNCHFSSFCYWENTMQNSKNIESCLDHCWRGIKDSYVRSPFSLLLGKSVGPNSFWLRQFKIVGVGVTIGPSVGGTFGPFVEPTVLGSQNCWSYFRPFCWDKIVGANYGPFVGWTKGPKVTPTILGA